MKHLFDSCTIIHKLQAVEIIKVASDYCREIKEPFAISDKILDELDKKYWDVTGDSAEDNALHNYVNLYVMSKTIEYIIINKENRILSNYNSIRKRYYGWMTNADYCKRLISNGTLDAKVYYSEYFRKKDCGECSLIAIALTDTDKYTIISEDKGRVCAHPDLNIFDIYHEKGVKIVCFDSWEHRDTIMTGNSELFNNVI